MKTFLELKTDVAVLWQRSGDSDALAKIGVWLNLGQLFLHKVYDWWPALEDIHNFSTANGTETYYMPKRFDKPLRVFDLTNDKELSPMTEQEYFSANISSIADSEKESAPSRFRLWGYSPVETQISSSGGTIQAKSSNATDGGAIIRVEGFIDSARTIIGYENITLGATATTAVAGTVTFYEITHFSKSQDTVGFITLENSSGTDLGYLGPNERVSFQRGMKIGKIPSQTNSMRVLFKKTNTKMVNDYDYPFMEADEYLILEAYGYALAQEKESMDRATIAWQKSKDVLTNILTNIQGNLGPQFLHKFESNWLEAHRI